MNSCSRHFSQLHIRAVTKHLIREVFSRYFLSFPSPFLLLPPLFPHLEVAPHTQLRYLYYVILYIFMLFSGLVYVYCMGLVPELKFKWKLNFKKIKIWGALLVLSPLTMAANAFLVYFWVAATSLGCKCNLISVKLNLQIEANAVVSECTVYGREIAH